MAGCWWSGCGIANPVIKLEFDSPPSFEKCYNNAMNKYVRRLVYINDKETKFINPLIYPFLLGTLIYGIGFAFLGDWSGVASSSLYQAMLSMHSSIPVAWGIGASMASGFAIILLLRRRGWWGGIASITGWMVWLFAAIVYAMEGYWLVFLTVALVYGYFWVYYYLSIKDFQRRS